MATIYEEMHGLAPKIEIQKRKNILEKFAHNRGVSERESTKYFSMLWEAFAWAAIIGFYHNKKKPLKQPLSEETDAPFKYSTLYNNGSDIFYSLVLFAIAKEGYEVVSNVNRINQVIEEYANGGFEVIHTIEKEKGLDYFGDEANFLQEIMERQIKSTEELEESIKEKAKEKKEVSTGEGFDLNF
ncbi:hypothetical protein [uncultured Psychroserpens sp.]|uniref:hypothetical protein n=1 Tax=uncultured Psychroserpens sp. TaxID=255436 RepID=UPI0026379223|nr:hypothetical protein [uncultured Psychroserpens sp.]